MRIWLRPRGFQILKERSPRLAKLHAVELGVRDGIRTRDFQDHNLALNRPSSTHHEMVMVISRRGELGMGLSQHRSDPREGIYLL